jgi:hypothetical protein
MKYAVEIELDGMIYTPSFIEIGLGIQKFLGGYTCGHTDRNVPMFIFSK